MSDPRSYFLIDRVLFYVVNIRRTSTSAKDKEQASDRKRSNIGRS